MVVRDIDELRQAEGTILISFGTSVIVPPDIFVAFEARTIFTQHRRNTLAAILTILRSTKERHVMARLCMS